VVSIRSILLAALVPIFSLPGIGIRSFEEMTCVLETAAYWEAKAEDRLPLVFNNLLETGYWAMPSARMDQPGVLGMGATWNYPYRLYNLRLQLYDRFELSGSYRIFCGLQDPALGHHGFGEFSDKGVNFKLALLLPEDTDYMFPGLAIGMEDFLGSRRFLDRYVVLTQVVRDADVELSFGYGQKRIHGFFGGVSWMPLRRIWAPYGGLGLVAEWDATNYKDDPHVGKGRRFNSRFNYGLQYNLDDVLHLSLSHQRGRVWSGSVALTYDLGKEEGLTPKIHATPPYSCPINTQPIGTLRTPEMMVHDLAFAMGCQGFTLRGAWIDCCGCDGPELYLQVVNGCYRQFKEARRRLNYLLAALIPSNICRVHLLFEWSGVLTHALTYETDFLYAFRRQEMSAYELKVATPMQDASWPPAGSGTLYQARNPYWMVWIEPFMDQFFGSASGKYKYVAGLSADFEGWLPGEVVYDVGFNYNALNNTHGIRDVDKLNPSQIVNVRSDNINYYQHSTVSLQRAFLQKNWNLSPALFARMSLGYYEIAYAGAAAELLYYPAGSDWAVGIEGGIFKKRNYRGLGFQSTLRQLHGFEPTFHHYNVLSQSLATFYYDLRPMCLDFAFSMGKYLANDWGASLQVERYFDSGLKIGCWMSYTSKEDRVNGDTHYADKGVIISVPLDFFMTRHTRARWNYGLSAWLRDIGARASTGYRLYPTIYNQRS
jgi:hypothetical protein